MEASRLVQDVMVRLGTEREAEGERALQATLETVGERLSAADAEAIAAELPPTYAEALHRGRREPSLGLDAFQARVARRAGIPTGYARELAQAVCGALRADLGADAVDRLDRALWPELLRPSLRDRLGPTTPATGHTLAEGRPGSRHPLSEARPPLHDTLSAGRPGSRHPLSEAAPEPSQTESVARENPHGERKLSSGH